MDEICWLEHGFARGESRGIAQVMHVVTSPTPPFSTAGARLEIHQIPSASDNLIWLVKAADTNEVVAVDGPEAATVLEYCARKDLRLTGVLNTHTHHDHIGINRDLQRRGLLPALRVVGPRLVQSEVPGLTEAVSEADTLELFGCKGRVLLTEGHINGHVSYVFEDVLFCGDTLFTGGCGYLFDGPPKKMFESLCRLSELDPETRICCAHEYTQDNLRFAWSVEPDNQALAERIRSVWAERARGRCVVPSTLRTEILTNPFLRFNSPSLREHVGRAMPEAQLETAEQVFTATRALKDRQQYKKLADAELPL